MIVLHIRKFLDCYIEFLFCTIIVLVGKIIFQCVEISFHRSIIVRISCFTHTLGDTKFYAEFRELFGGVLTALIRMYQKLTQINSRLRVDCSCQRPLSQVSCYVSLCYACNDTSIMKVYNCAIITLATIGQK